MEADGRRQARGGQASSRNTTEDLLGCLAEGRLPDPEDVWKRLAAPSSTPFKQALLQPLVDDEAAYWAWLFAAIKRWLREARRVPDEFLELLAEGAVFSIQTRDRPFPHDPWRPYLKGVPCRVWKRFMKRPVAWFPFPLPGLQCLWRGRQKRQDPGLKRRLRLLQVTLNEGTRAVEQDPERTITATDIASMAWRRRGCSEGLRRPGRGRWLQVGRALRAGPWRSAGHETDEALAGEAIERIYWGGYERNAMNRFAALMDRQAEELSEVRRLAREASGMRRRVVLSCHNASLAAMGGWAFEPVLKQIGDRSLRHSFMTRAMEKAQLLERRLTAEAGAEFLWQRWKERLIVPQAQRLLWEARMRRAVEGEEGGPETVQERQSIARLEALAGDLDNRRRSLTWTGPLHPAQHARPSAFLQWYEGRRNNWTRGLATLLAVIEIGNDLLRDGQLPCLVVPWIDKFFISSKREKDIDYLVALVDWIDAQGAEPFILFWEDTCHEKDCSFASALRRLGRNDWMGVGVLGSGSTRRSDARRILSEASSGVRLVALRPVSDEHYRISLDELLSGLDREFLHRYDSSWKDNLVCIYAGTQVAPLLSIQGDPETFPTWVVVRGRKVPLGRYLRAWLRRRVIPKGDRGDSQGGLEGFSKWCNLQ